MAKAKKLPSGQWRVLVYSHTDPDGKRHYESFTADSKREAEYQAAEFARDKDRKGRPENLIVAEVVQKYIEIKTNVLSPSTIRGYENTARNYIYKSSISKYNIRSLSQIELQKWVGDLADSFSPKTVRNAYGLLLSAVEMFVPDFKAKVTLPQKKDPALYVPSDSDIKHILSHIQGKELEIAVLLAAFGPMRRSEICALTTNDIRGNIVTVNKAMVLDANNQWTIKSPKTLSSYREIKYPQFVIDKIKKNGGRIIEATPDQLSSRFRRAIRFSHSPKFRFHDLRHYGASIMHAIGIPDQYIMDRGGWASDRVMKKIYIGTISEEKERATDHILNHFADMQHEIQHGIKKS